MFRLAIQWNYVRKRKPIVSLENIVAVVYRKKNSIFIHLSSFLQSVFKKIYCFKIYSCHYFAKRFKWLSGVVKLLHSEEVLCAKDRCEN